MRSNQDLSALGEPPGSEMLAGGFLSPVCRALGNRYTMGRSVGHGLHETMKEVWPGQLGLLLTSSGTWGTDDDWSQPQGPDQHGSLLERVSPATKLGPVDTVLVAAAVVATMVPHTIEVGVGTGMIPPASPLVQGTVTCGERVHVLLTRIKASTSTLLVPGFCQTSPGPLLSSSE